MGTEIPQELFEPFGKAREYHFVNLKGEEETQILGKSDYLSHQKCPIDGTNFVMVDGMHEHKEHCYCCGGPYIDFTDYSEEQKENYLKEKYLPGLKRKIKSKKDELQELENLEKIVSNRDSEIIKKNRENSCYNKANLSAQELPSENPEDYKDYMKSYGYSD
jgi:hypothetical protein